MLDMIPLFLPSGIENCTPSSLLTDVGAEVTSSNLSAALLHLRHVTAVPSHVLSDICLMLVLLFLSLTVILSPPKGAGSSLGALSSR